MRFDLKSYELESGKLQAFAWPGGYPVFYVTGNCGVLCPKCANDNRKLLNDPDDKQWYVIGVDINYEDYHLFCDNCNSQIEPAYEDD